MKQHASPNIHFFFATAPMPCPYLPGRQERRLVTELSGRQAAHVHDMLSQAGFRRSHCVAYVPVCRDCRACAAVRIKVAEFVCSRSHRRIIARNQDLTVTTMAARATDEQYALFRNYQIARHHDGEMARMDFYDYQTLVEDTPVDSILVEFRQGNGNLIGCSLVDRMADGYSAVYSFFDPSQGRRSLGSFIILWLIQNAQFLKLQHVYLGFWVAGCQKMAYKARYQPLEAYTPEGWKPLRPDNPETTRYFESGNG